MGGPPRSGMVVCRPLRSSLPETPMQTSPLALYADKTQLFFEFLCFPQHLHFPDSGMGRYSRVWNGGFQAFAARPAGNPLAPKCRPCYPRLMQTTPYSPSNHYVLLTTHTSWLPRWRRPPKSAMVVCRPLRSSPPETPGTPQCRPRRQDTPTLFLPDSDGEGLQGT